MSDAVGGVSISEGISSNTGVESFPNPSLRRPINFQPETKGAGSFINLVSLLIVLKKQ